MLRPDDARRRVHDVRPIAPANAPGLNPIRPTSISMTFHRLLLHAFALLPAALLSLSPSPALGQSEAGTIPAGTPLALTIDQHIPMRNGQPIRAHLVYPIYADNHLLLPKDTIVTGSVVDLRADHTRRVHALLGGDFTPFRSPVVRFTHILLPGGAVIPFASDNAASGTPIYRAVAPPPAKGGFIHQQFDAGLTMARSDLATFTAPGKGDRLLQFLYAQLPYHPQRIESGTSWTIETTAALPLPAQPAPPPPPLPRKPRFWQQPTLPAPASANDSGTWTVQASLTGPLSSEKSIKGEAIEAVVAEPIYNPDHTLAVPQGATLVGAVTRAKPSRRFGRTGVLSFSFSQLTLPNAESQAVETRLTGADSPQDIALNSEGQAKSKPQDKIAIPLILALMASRPLDQEHHGADRQLGKNAVGGSAGLGLLGAVVGLAGGSPNVAAGIGYWGAARAMYSRWIARGQKITFAKDTRIVVETTPRHSAPIKPNAKPSP